MANLSSEERRKRYSRLARNEDVTQSEAKKDNTTTKADERRNRYASKEYLEKYNEYHRPTSYDGSAVNRYLNAYGLNQQRSAERQQKARSRYNQQQFMNAHRNAVLNGIDNGNNPLGLKNLDNPLDNQRRYREYENEYDKTHKMSYADTQKLEKAYGNANRQQLEALKEHFETAKDRDYSGELEWVKDKLLTTATGKENQYRQSILKKQIKSADDRLARLQEVYADKLVGGGADNDDYLQKVNALKQEKNNLQSELNEYQELESFQDADDFAAYRLKGEADPNNAVRFYRTHSDEQANKILDPTINNEVDTEHHETLYTGGGSNESDRALFRTITDEEADNYSYLLGKYGQERADKYLQDIAKHTDVNGAITKMKEAQEQGKKNPLLRTAESIGLGALSPLEAAKNIISGDEFRTYDDYAIAGRQEALRSGANEALTKGNEVGSFIYNTATSAADNLLRYGIGGALGAATESAAVGEGAMRLMMAGQVGDSAMKEALDRGLSNSQAMTTAIISAINEELFETISIEKLKAMKAADPKKFRDIAKNIGKQFISEGSEEVFTDIGNAIADDLVNGEKSEIATNIRNYMKQGLSEEEAKKKAAVDFAMQLVESGLSGGITGGLMGGSVAIQQANELDNKNKYKQITQNYMDAGLDENAAYDAAYNDVWNGLETVRDKEGKIKEYKGIKKSLKNAIASTQTLAQNVKQIEDNVNSGVANTTSINGAENRFNETQKEYLNNQNEYLNDNNAVMPEVNNANTMQGLETQTTNTASKNETAFNQQKNASEVGVANNATTETLPQKMEFKAAANGNVGRITSVNKDNITIKDATGHEQTVAIKDAEMTDGAKAAVDQAKQYGVNGSRLYLENLPSDNIRNYTVAFNSYYNAGKQGKSFYGLGTFGLMKNDNNAYNNYVKNLLTEVYDAGIRDNSKATKQGGLIRNDARYSVNERVARMTDVVAKATNTTVQFDKMLSHDANGYYDRANDIIHISTTAQNPSMVVFCHELTHRLKQTSNEAYQEYENYVIDYLKNQTKKDENGIDQNLYETMFVELKNKYNRQGVSLSDAAVNEEIVANATEAFLTDGEAINNFVENSDRNVVQKIIDVIKSIIDDIKEVFGKEYEVKNAGAKAIKANLDVYNHALELWINAIEKQNVASNKKSGTKFSLKEDSEGRELSPQQQEYFKDSKVVDENGNLKVMYHGTTKAGFTVFNSENSDDKISLFFTDNPDVAKSYSNTRESFIPDKQLSLSEMRSNVFDYTNGDNKIIKYKDGYALSEIDPFNDEDEILYESKNLNDVYDYFLKNIVEDSGYNGKINNANYEVYLNIKNPLIIDAQERMWDELVDLWDKEVKSGYNYLMIYNDLGDGKYEIEASDIDEGDITKVVTDKYLKSILTPYEYKKLLLGDEVNDVYIDTNNDRVPTKTREYAKYAKEKGYDGVIIKNVIDNGNFYYGDEVSDVVIAFDSNQVKSVANKKPTDNPDIRFSLKESNDFYKETGFDVRTLTDSTPENIIWYASRNERAINKYLEDRKVNIEPVIIDKKINNLILNGDIIKNYIKDNDLDIASLVTDTEVRDKFYNFVENEYINKADKSFIRKRYQKYLDAIKAAVNGDDYIDGYWRYNFDKLDEDINSIKNPTQEEDKYATKNKKQDYVEEHYNDFEKYLGDKIEKIFGWSLNGEKEKTSDEDKERHVEDAINRFGTLSEKNRNWNKGAYITLTGDVLDFGGKGSDIRSHDHRDISAVYDEDESTKYRLFNPTDYLNQFLSEGNVRIMPESSSIDMNSNEEPNSKQYATIRDYIDDYAAETGKCIIEFSDDDGRSVDSKYYENNINSSQIINDIKRFYREGKIGGSDLNQFRYSLKEDRNEVEQLIKDIYDRKIGFVDSYTIGDLPNIYHKLFDVPVLNLVIQPKHAYFNMASLNKVREDNVKMGKNDHPHNIKPEKYADLLYKLEDPLAIYNNNSNKVNKPRLLIKIDNRYGAILELYSDKETSDKTNRNNHAIITIFDTTKTKDGKKRKTSYYKDYENRILYKKEATETEAIYKTTVDRMNQNASYEVNISDFKNEVNMYLRNPKEFVEHFRYGSGTLADAERLDDNKSYSLKEDSEGNKLSPQQQEYFKDSKAVDDEGNLLVMYHGTENSGFTVFDKDYFNSAEGFFFTNRLSTAKGYSATEDIINLPKINSIKDFENEVNKQFNNTDIKVKKNGNTFELYEVDNDYEDYIDEADNLSDLYVKYLEYKGDIGYSYNYKVYLNVKNPLIVDAKGEFWDKIKTDFSKDTMTTNELVDYARKNNYDGLIVKNVLDNALYNTSEEFYKPGIDIVAFDSNQIKNVDNENPTDNPDIRFSLKEESNIDRNTVASVTGKDPYMAEAVKDLEDIMKMKGGEAFFRANQKELYKIYDEIAEEYHIKDYSKKMFADNVKELFDYIQSVDNPSGIDTTMLGMQIAGDMLDKGSITDTSMQELYPLLQQQLRDYRIKIADQDKGDLDGGYNEFRKRYFGTLTLANDGTEVDTVYEDLAASYPELFPEDITAPGDRLTQIAEVADMFRRTVDHIEGATREESAFIIAQDIINRAVLEQTKKNKSVDNKKRLKAQEKVRKQNTNLKKAKKDIHDEYVKLKKKVEALEYLNERANKKITKLENEIGRNKKEFADWAAGKRQVNKEDKLYKQRYDKLMQEYSKKKVAELQKKYSSERRKNIEKIRKMVKELDRSVRRPDKNHYVPKYLVSSMLDVLRTIDLDSGYRKPDGSETLVYMKLKEMQKQYEEMQNDMDYAIASEYNETISKAIGRLAEITKGRRLNELLDNDIADIVEIMEIINYQMKTARDLLENDKLSDIKEASQKAREQIKESGRTFNTDAKFKNLANRYLNDSLSPVRVMRRLEGYAHDGVLSSLAAEIQEGERKTKLLRQRANAILEELYKDTKAIKALEKFRTEKLVYNVGGKNIILTPDMRAAIYLHSLNEQNMKHIVGNKTKEGSYRGGGIIIPNYQKQLFNNKNNVKVNTAEKYTGQDAVRLSPSDVQRIIKDMTPYDRRIVELYQEVNDMLTKELNDTTLKMYGFKKATVKNYFPLIVDKSILNLDSDVLKFDKTLESFGFLKERVNSAKPIYLEGVMDALERQIDQSTLFSGMAIPSRDFKKVWNYAAMDENDKFDNVNKQAQKSMGSYIDEYVQNLQADLAQARPEAKSSLSRFFGSKARGKVAMGALTGNISVVLKQAASYPTAAGGVLGYQDLLNGLMPHGQRGKTLENTINQYTPLYQDRNTAAITGVNINDMNILKRRNPNLYYALTGWIEAMDKATVRRLWYASENYVKRNYKYEVGSDAYYEEVAKVWEDTIRKTQPIYDTMNRPEYLRQKDSLVKFLMMFKTQALQNVGILVENFGEYKARVRDYEKDKSDFNKKERDLAFKQLRKSVSSQIIQSIIFTGITALVDAIIKHRPDKWADEETGLITPESLSTKLFDAWQSNVISQLAFGDIIRDTLVNPARTLITGKEVKRYDISVAPVDTINTIIDGLNKAAKYSANGDTDKAKEEILEVVSTGSQFGLGLPVNNIENLYNGLKENINDIKSGKNPLEATNEKQMYNRVFIAYAAGDKAEAERLSKDLDSDKLKTKMVSKLKDEETIQEAADYRYNSDLASYQAIVDAYVKLGFNEDWVVSAINSDMNKKYGTKGSVSKGSTFNSSDLSRAIDISAVQGSKVAQSLYDDKYNKYIAEGMSKEDAKKKAMSSVKSSITSYYKPKFEAGNTSEKVKIRDRLASIKVNGEKLYTYDSIKKWNE